MESTKIESTKITEKEIANVLKNNAHVLVTQQEISATGQEVESLRRIPLAVFLEKCGGTGNGDADVDMDEVEQIVDEYLAANPPSAAPITINGEKPDPGGNFVINTVSDVEIAQLAAALT